MCYIIPARDVRRKCQASIEEKSSHCQHSVSPSSHTRSAITALHLGTHLGNCMFIWLVSLSHKVVSGPYSAPQNSENCYTYLWAGSPICWQTKVVYTNQIKYSRNQTEFFFFLNRESVKFTNFFPVFFFFSTLEIGPRALHKLNKYATIQILPCPLFLLFGCCLFVCFKLWDIIFVNFPTWFWTHFIAQEDLRVAIPLPQSLEL